MDVDFTSKETTYICLWVHVHLQTHRVTSGGQRACGQRGELTFLQREFVCALYLSNLRQREVHTAVSKWPSSAGRLRGDQGHDAFGPHSPTLRPNSWSGRVSYATQVFCIIWEVYPHSILHWFNKDRLLGGLEGRFPL